MYLGLASAAGVDASWAEIRVRRLWSSVVNGGVGGGGHGYGCASGRGAIVGEAGGLALEVCAAFCGGGVLKRGRMAEDAQVEVRIVVMVVWACKRQVGGWMVAMWLSWAASGY